MCASGHVAVSLSHAYNQIIINSRLVKGERVWRRFYTQLDHAASKLMIELLYLCQSLPYCSNTVCDNRGIE
jgi:hypothetical protein